MHSLSVTDYNNGVMINRLGCSLYDQASLCKIDLQKETTVTLRKELLDGIIAQIIYCFAYYYKLHKIN